VIRWKRRGLIVVLALSVILLASDPIFGFKESLVNDILRIGVFFLMAIVGVLPAEGLEDARVKAAENRLWYETIFRNTGTATAFLGKKTAKPETSGSLYSRQHRSGLYPHPLPGLRPGSLSGYSGADG